MQMAAVPDEWQTVRWASVQGLGMHGSMAAQPPLPSSWKPVSQPQTTPWPLREQTLWCGLLQGSGVQEAAGTHWPSSQ
jgi:hypothetical protein